MFCIRRRKAALAAIDTLSDYDWVGIVLFNDRVMAYGDYLIPATVPNKALMVNYINSNLVDAGGTNFRDSLNKVSLQSWLGEPFYGALSHK